MKSTIFLLVLSIIIPSLVYSEWDSGKSAKEAGIMIKKSIGSFKESSDSLNQKMIGLTNEIKNLTFELKESFESFNKNSTELDQKMISLTRQIKYLTIVMVILAIFAGFESLMRISRIFCRKRKEIQD